MVLVIVPVMSAAGLGLSMEEAGAATAAAIEAAVMVAAGLKADMVWPIPLGLTWGMPLGLFCPIVSACPDSMCVACHINEGMSECVSECMSESVGERVIE